MTSKTKPDQTLIVFGRQVGVVWDENNKKFVPIFFRDTDADNAISVHLGQSTHYSDKKAGIKHTTPSTKSGTITKLSYPYENKWLQWLVEIEGVEHPLEYQWEVSSE